MKHEIYSSPKPQSPTNLIRLNKVIAQRAGIARRKADAYIEAGRIAVNGKTVRVLGTKIDPINDSLSVDGTVVSQQAQVPIVYRFYKPKGVVSTMNDEQHRPSIQLFIPAAPTVFPVGRLDRSSEGLLLLTNDGDMALRLSHPRYRQQKTYRVWIHKVHSRALGKVQSDLERGYMVGSRRRSFDSVTYYDSDDDGIAFDVTLHEGIYHEVKRLVDRAGYTVARLVRIQHGPLKLGSLEPGQYEQLSEQDYRQLRLDVQHPPKVA